MNFARVFFLAFPLIWTGCTKTTYIPYEESKQIQVKHEIETLHVRKNGIAKGYVKALYLEGEKSLWVYEVAGTDTSNGKLPFIRFFSDKKIANLNDRIYVVVKDERLVEYFVLNTSKVIKKAKVKEKIKEEVMKESTHKRTKKRKTPWLEVPQSESISLD